MAEARCGSTFSLQLRQLTEANAARTLAADYSAAAGALGDFGDYMVEYPQKLLTGAYAVSKATWLTTQRQNAFAAAAARPTACARACGGTFLAVSHATRTTDPAAGGDPERTYNDGTPAYPMKNSGSSGDAGEGLLGGWTGVVTGGTNPPPRPSVRSTALLHPRCSSAY